jgi:hypothetical protein
MPSPSNIHALLVNVAQQMLDEVKKEAFALKEENAALRVQKHGAYKIHLSFYMCVCRIFLLHLGSFASSVLF